MSNRMIQILTGVVVAATFILLALNLSTFFQQRGDETYLAFNEVKGSAIVVGGVEFTLNFSQQTELVNWLNRAVPEGLKLKTTPSKIQQVVIYRFAKAPLQLKVVGLNDNNLIFAVPEWNNGEHLQDVSRGALNKLLTEAYPDAKTP